MGAGGNVQREHIEHRAGEKQKEVKPDEMVRWKKPGGGAGKTGKNNHELVHNQMFVWADEVVFTCQNWMWVNILRRRQSAGKPKVPSMSGACGSDC